LHYLTKKFSYQLKTQLIYLK